MPIRSVEDVIPHLVRATHWREGLPAKYVADSWFQTNGIPRSLASLIKAIPEPKSAELIDDWLERKTDLRDNCGAPSQTDLLALLGISDRTAVLGIEAKVDESFGPFVHEWVVDGSQQKHRRLGRLCERLGLAVADAMPLRYQLLHRTAATLIEATRFRTQTAMFAVQSFCAHAAGFGDFARFAAAMDYGPVQQARLSGPRTFGGTGSWIGWNPYSK